FPYSLRSCFILLSFHSYLALRYLHSFPTRRSSDLNESWTVRSVAAPDRRMFGRGQCPVTPSRLVFSRTFESSTAIAPHRIRAFWDRKSTRLNSSHVSISYAVFCLKKKNNYDQRPPACQHHRSCTAPADGLTPLPPQPDHHHYVSVYTPCHGPMLVTHNDILHVPRA